MNTILWAFLVSIPPVPPLHIIYRIPAPEVRVAIQPTIPGLPLGIGNTARDLLEHRP